jgi:hypothetical protein
MKRVPVKPRVGVRDKYAEQGVKRYYEQHGHEYKNPHEMQIRELLKRNHKRFDCSKALDLACGNGEVSKVLKELGYGGFLGVDPYTCASYETNTGASCVPYNFDDILKGKLTGRFSSIICSYGLHLVEESKLPKLIVELLKHSDTIVIITPHKRPELEKYGLSKVYEDFALLEKGKRVRMKVYRK